MFTRDNFNKYRYIIDIYIYHNYLASEHIQKLITWQYRLIPPQKDSFIWRLNGNIDNTVIISLMKFVILWTLDMPSSPWMNQGVVWACLATN